MNKTWAMDKGYSNLFKGSQSRKLGFEDFMRLQKDPSFLFSEVLAKYSPGFIEVQQKFGV